MRFLNKPSWTQIILPLVFCFHSAAQGQYGERGDYGGGGGDGFLGWLILGGPILLFVYTTMSLDDSGGEAFGYMCVGAILAVGFAFIGIPPWIAYFLVQGHIIYRLKTK